MPKFCHVPQLCHSVSFCHAGPFLVMLSEVVIDKVAEVYTEETSACSFSCCRSFDSLRSLRMTIGWLRMTRMGRYRILSFLGRIMTGIDNFNDVLCT